MGVACILRRGPPFAKTARVPLEPTRSVARVNRRTLSLAQLPGEVTVKEITAEWLQGFADAFNRHDADEILSFMGVTA